jgi:hypothetical protein
MAACISVTRWTLQGIVLEAGSIGVLRMDRQKTLAARVKETLMAPRAFEDTFFLL